MSDWIRLSALARLRDAYVKMLLPTTVTNRAATLQVFDAAMATITAEEDVSSVNEDQQEQFRYHNNREFAFQDAARAVMEIGKTLWAAGNEQAGVYKSVAQLMTQRANEEADKARKTGYIKK